MNGRLAFGGRALLLALVLRCRPALAGEAGGGCTTATDEASRLRCQLEEARALVSRQSLLIEENNIELERKEAIIKEKDIELARKEAVNQDMEVQFARKAAQASKPSPRTFAQTAWKEQRKYPDQLQRSHLSKPVIGKEYKHPDTGLSKDLVDEDSHRRLLGQTKDLATIIASYPKNKTTISLPNSGLTGTVPAELGKFTQLKSLDLHGNQLTGTVPADLGNLVKLKSLDLSKNQLTGTLPPELGNLKLLTSMYFGYNQHTGTVPADFGKLTKLSNLELSGNQLTGTIPPELGNTQLATLMLDNNRLSGTIPPEFGQLTELTDLFLYRNLLTGALPAEMGNCVQLANIYISSNNFTGTVPAEWGQLEQLMVLDLQQNSLTGQLPDELGSLVSLTELHVNGNQFSGTLPDTIGQVQALQLLNISDNPGITGTFPDTTSSTVITILASNCGFTSAGAVGDTVQTISFANNKFTELPTKWVNLTGVLDLDLSNNRVSQWRPHGVIPADDIDTNFNWMVGPILPRLNWPVIQSVKLSGNPLGLGTTFRDFVWSLAYLTTLSELLAANCSLQGEVPIGTFPEYFTLDLAYTGDDWGEYPPRIAGFRGLLTLDVSDNQITALMPPPPPRLSLADLHGNPIVHLGDEWYTKLNNLEVWNDPLLQVDVLPPFRERGCLNAGTSMFEADPLGFVTTPGEDAFQCTTLCAGLRTRYKHDASLNFSSLCRCTAGRQGAATNCTGCPADTYSAPEDKWEMVRTCRACPERSSTELVENATSSSQCKCQAGWYMETPAAGAANVGAGPQCKRCKQGRFMDTMPGATQESQCMCNASFDGLRALLGFCGCADGLYLDNLALACRPCDQVAEECTWGSQIQLSLLPPVIKPSYWAAPPPDVGPDEVSNFSKNDIWRCFSKDTCLGNSTCADGRVGTACSLCDEGMFGGPDGPCLPCPYTPEESRKALLWGLLIGPGATVAAHMMLQLNAESRGAAFSLAALKTSLQQCLKYIQMLGVMAGFNINWPPMALNFMTEVAQITVALPRVAGVACLSGQQSASLEMGFRWLMPVAGLLSACLSALLLAPISLLGRCTSSSRASCLNKFLHMSYWDVLRVSLWGLALFYSSMLQFGTQVLACMPGPNGMTTVVTFPHLQCGEKGEWAKLAGISVAFLLVFVGAVFLGIYLSWRRAASSLVETNFKSSGWWGFLFTDFRHGWEHWLMIIMAKDAALVVVATASASNGPGQLLGTVAVSILYAYIVLRDQPFRDPSNSILEAWTMMSVAVLAIVMAGMGFQSSAGLADVADLYRDGASDPQYKSRELTLLIVQISTFAGPAVIMLYQLLCVSEKVQNRLPAFVRPPTEQDRAKWTEEFFQSFKIDEASTPELRGVMDRFDVVDTAKFRDLMSSSVATLGILPARGVKLQHMVRKRFTKEFHKVGSRSSFNLSASLDSINQGEDQGQDPATEFDPNQGATVDEFWGVEVDGKMEYSKAWV